MDISVRPEPITASVTVSKVVTKEYEWGEMPSCAFGTRVDTGESVFINSKTVKGCSLEEGRTYTMKMAINDKYLAGESDTKFFAFYVKLPKAAPQALPTGIFQMDLEEFTDDAKRLSRAAERARCDEILKLGGVWTAVRMTGAIIRRNFSSTSDMTEDQRKICYALDQHMRKRHEDGTLAAVEIYKKEEQSRASYVFFTEYPEKLADALRAA